MKYDFCKSVTRFAMSFAAIFFFGTMTYACDGTESGGETKETPVLEVLSPADGSNVTLDVGGTVDFSWNPVAGISDYMLVLSLQKEMSNKMTLPLYGNPWSYTGLDFDSVLERFGVEKGASVDLFWTVRPTNDRLKVDSPVRKMHVARFEDPDVFLSENADPIVVKVGVLYEDMVVASEGKRLHECCNWADPHQQVKDMVRYMTECSHGVIQYQIAVEIESEVPYAYYVDTGKPVTADICFHEMFPKRQYPGLYENVRYNYSKMVTDNGFDKMMNNHEIDEVWVYNHPGAGMFETCMAGPGAFWINGDIFDVPTLERKLSVLFCNYERTVDLAMHSCAHRFENVMKEVYGRWSYDVPFEKDLNNWERFSAYKLTYDKYDHGASHIGNCHFPCNAVADYSYESDAYIRTYCDNWNYYPHLDYRGFRVVDSGEWGSSQMGYMHWFYKHVPHFKGLNTDPADMHLNNWWYYLVDFDAAMEYEKKLREEAAR